MVTYFSKHPQTNAAAHLLIGIGLGILLFRAVFDPHPVRWGIGLIVLGVLIHVYPLTTYKTKNNPITLTATFLHEIVRLSLPFNISLLMLNLKSFYRTLTKTLSSEANRLGFTLIEILVAIAILGIMMTIGYVTYHNAQIAGRDYKRKADLKQLRVALELYRQSHGSYPPSNNPPCIWVDTNVRPPILFWNEPFCASISPGLWIPGLDQSYINALPHGQPGPAPEYGVLVYWSGDLSTHSGYCTPGNYYMLLTLLENMQDKDAAAHTPPKWCDGIHDIEGVDRNAYLLTSY